MCDSPNKGSLSEASYLRKIKKPLIEKKRRERINTCLNQLKEILLDNIKQNGTQVSKLDKADILEMTVSHLRQIQHQQLSIVMATDIKAATEFSAGYHECAREAMRFIDTTHGQGHVVQSGLQNHLINSMNSAQHVQDRYQSLPNLSISVPRRPSSAGDVPSSSHQGTSPLRSWNANMTNSLLIPVEHFTDSRSRQSMSHHAEYCFRPDLNGNHDNDTSINSSIISDLSPREAENGNQSHVSYDEPSSPHAGDQSDEESRDNARVDMLNVDNDEESVWRPW